MLKATVASTSGSFRGRVRSPTRRPAVSGSAAGRPAPPARILLPGGAGCFHNRVARRGTRDLRTIPHTPSAEVSHGPHRFAAAAARRPGPRPGAVALAEGGGGGVGAG